MNIFDYIGIPIARADNPVAGFVGRVDRYILNPLIIFMFAGALVYFIIGVFQYFLYSDQASEREIGKDHIIWGIIGMFLMFAVFTIMRIITNTLGVGGTNPILQQ